MIFSMPVTPTRERLIVVSGLAACASATSITVAVSLAMDQVCPASPSGPGCREGRAYTLGVQGGRGPGGARLATVRQPAAGPEQGGLGEPEKLQRLIARGGEHGYLTFEEIGSALEEVELSKKQLTELHSRLVEQGVDVIAEDGVSAYRE